MKQNEEVSATEYWGQIQALGWKDSQIKSWREKMEGEFLAEISSSKTYNTHNKMMLSPFKPEKTGSYHSHLTGKTTGGGTFIFKCFATSLSGGCAVEFFYCLEHGEKPSRSQLDEYIVSYALQHNYPRNYSVSSQNEQSYNYEGRVQNFRQQIIDGLIDNEILVPTEDTYQYSLNQNISKENAADYRKIVHDLLDSILSNEVEQKLPDTQKYKEFYLSRINANISQFKTATLSLFDDLVEHRDVYLLTNKKQNADTKVVTESVNNIVSIHDTRIALPLTDNEARSLRKMGSNYTEKTVKDSIKANGGLLVTNDFSRGNFAIKSGIPAVILPRSYSKLNNKGSVPYEIKEHYTNYPLIQTFNELYYQTDKIFLDDGLVTDNENFQKNHILMYLKNAIAGLEIDKSIEMFNLPTKTSESINSYFSSIGDSSLFRGFYGNVQNSNKNLSSLTKFISQTEQEQDKYNEIVFENDQIRRANKNKEAKQKFLQVPFANFGNVSARSYVHQYANELHEVYKRTIAKEQQVKYKEYIGNNFPLLEKLNLVLEKNLNKKTNLDEKNTVVKDEKILSFNNFLQEQYENGRSNNQFSIFLKQRGFSSAVDSSGQLLFEKFGLGYSNGNEKDTFNLTGGNYSFAIKNAGLQIMNPDSPLQWGNMMTNRITFPIRNIQGEVISFAGREIKDHTPVNPESSTPKYLNGENNPNFLKGLTYYGLFESLSDIQKKNNAVIVEGYMDCIACHGAGIENAVASMGTALDYKKLAKIYEHTDSITLMFDGDSAGFNAALRSFNAFISGTTEYKEVGEGKDKTYEQIILPSLFAGVRDFKLVVLPKLPNFGHNENLQKGIDPDEFIQQFGKVALQQEIDNAYQMDEILIMSAFNSVFEKDGQRMELLGDEAAMVRFQERVEDLLKGVSAHIEMVENKLTNEQLSQSMIERGNNIIKTCKTYQSSVREKTQRVSNTMRWMKALSLTENLSLKDTYNLYGNRNPDNFVSRLVFKDQVEPILADRYKVLAEQHLTTQQAFGVQVENQLNNNIERSQENKVNSQPTRQRMR